MSYSQLVIDNDVAPRWSMIACPSCGEIPGMEYGDTPHVVGPDNDDYDSPAGTRGGWLETRGYCSCCGEAYSLILANHKGMLSLSIASIGQFE